MKDISLYCKSFNQDVLRAAKLAESIRRYNHQNLPFYLSCPSSDLPLFKNTVGSDGVIFLSDEEIVATNKSINQEKLNQLHGGLSQQIVKSEFWRLGVSENYVCLDSDAYFIKNFERGSFLTPGGAPYTVMNQSLELLLFGALHHHAKIEKNIVSERRALMEIWERDGQGYDFGPLPVVWSRHVWSDLATKFLEPRGMSFMDAILLFPSEMRWYGEALLKFRSVELWPVETLFRCYHYEAQYREAKKAGETEEMLSKIYWGVCTQSNWDDELSYGQFKRSALSKLARSIKHRLLGRLA